MHSRDQLKGSSSDLSCLGCNAFRDHMVQSFLKAMILLQYLLFSSVEGVIYLVAKQFKHLNDYPLLVSCEATLPLFSSDFR